MKRIITILTVALVMAAMMVASAGGAFAFANPGNNGNAENAPGQEQAQANCGETIMKQFEKRCGGRRGS